MAIKPQTVCYPSQANANGQKPVSRDDKPMCTGCNTNDPHTKPSCCDGGGSNTTNNADTCSAWCVVSCNSVCDTAQAYCSIGHEKINSHSDVGAHPAISCISKDEFIFRNWTARYWNSLGDKLDTAENVGYTENQGVTAAHSVAVADPCNNNHPGGSLVTASKYNEIVKKLNRFHLSLGSVKGAAQVGCELADVIRGAHAAALVNGYNSATFNPGVCDQCNITGQTNPTCDCNCDCPCDCNCGCSCGCSNSGE